MPRNYIEFATECTTERSVSSAHGGGAFLKTPVDEIDGKISTLIIDNEPAEVDASVVQRLVDALRLTEMHEAARRRVDCVVFTTILAKGFYRGVGYDSYKDPSLRRRIDFGRSALISEKSEHMTPMRPVVMGSIGGCEALVPCHATMRLPSEDPIWVHKLGGLQVRLASVAYAASFYRASHIAEVSRILYTDCGGVILDYTQSELVTEKQHSYT